MYVQGDATINGKLTMTARGAAVDLVTAGTAWTFSRYSAIAGASGTAGQSGCGAGNILVLYAGSLSMGASATITASGTSTIPGGNGSVQGPTQILP